MADQIEVIVGDLSLFAERIVKRIALNLDANLRETTPVLTGWARANWIPSIGSAFSGTAGSREALDHSAHDAGAVSIAAGYKLGPPIYESNSVPYIGKLNAGSSAKAPPAFVQAAIVRAVEMTVRRPG